MTPARRGPRPLPTDPLVRTGRFDNYGSVLALLVATFVVGMAGAGSNWWTLLNVATQGITLLFVLHVSRARPRLQRLARIAVPVAIAVAVGGGGFGNDRQGSATALVVSGALAAIGPIVVLNGSVRRTTTIDRETVSAALSIYLMIGLFFGFLYGATAAVTGEAFFAQELAARQADYLYFSFTVLTTTGFGDLSAATRLGRSFTMLEAVIGQIYLVTVVALVVSNLGRARRTDPGTGGDAPQ